MGRIRLTGATSGYTELRAANAAGNNTIILPTTNGGEVIVSDSSGNVNIDSGTFYVDASNNRVGVGTSSPSQKLVVNGASGSNAIQIENSDDSNRGGRLSATGSAANGTFLINSTSSGYGISLGIDGTSALSIDTARRVGVGTTSPGASLHVAGAIASAPTGSGLLAGINGNYGQAKLYGTTGGILDFGASGADANARLLVNNSDNALQFYTNNGGSLSERLRIDSSGRVGIGTSTVIWDLEIARGAGSSAYIGVRGNNNTYGNALLIGQDSTGVARLVQEGGNPITFWTGGTAAERMRLDSSGRLGIGTTSAQQLLHVNGSNASLLVTGATNTSGFLFGVREDGQDTQIGNLASGGAIRFLTNPSGGATERARIDSSGRLLVGTSSASGNALLQVAGGIRQGTLSGKPDAAGVPAVGETRIYNFNLAAANTWEDVLTPATDGNAFYVIHFRIGVSDRTNSFGFAQLYYSTSAQLILISGSASNIRVNANVLQLNGTGFGSYGLATAMHVTRIY